ncbi:cell wall-associated hydrolase, invasion-associated protein (plasmid) [Mycolicibacterium chubuense NBB4]|uniref:Cell wall-associated hydrolase, invasion-associated protein n=1 Tax=Mycolicibacterium chubuense (strain NBB4) TaxID=710421 RepID=I4BTR0_MYCCN|nr:cell wall-associated hydrolase, invasion-associated protein [Mycolicibacterium chubuense NBB4]
MDTVPASWRGGGGEGYRLAGGNGVAALDNVVGADGQVGPQVVSAANESREGRSGMNGVLSDTRSGVNAIAPSTDTPAGKTVLVNHLETQLDRAKALLTRSEQRNIALANIIRAASGGYGGRPTGGGMPMGGGMGTPIGGMGGGGAGVSGALGGLPGMLSGLNGSSRGDASLLARRTHAGGLGLPSGATARAVAYAKSKLGAPYVWGAQGPNSFDCSGLTQAAYAEAGVHIPRTTYEQVRAGQAVDRGDIQEGDLIFCNWSAPGTPEHVMMAVSPTMAIEAPTPGHSVKISPIPNGHIEIRRVVG